MTKPTDLNAVFLKMIGSGQYRDLMTYTHAANFTGAAPAPKQPITTVVEAVSVAKHAALCAEVDRLKVALKEARDERGEIQAAWADAETKLRFMAHHQRQASNGEVIANEINRQLCEQVDALDKACGKQEAEIDELRKRIASLEQAAK